MNQRMIRLVLSIVMTLGVAGVFAKDKMMIGAYSTLRSFYYLKSTTTHPETDNINKALSDLIRGAGFNTTLGIAQYSPDDKLVENLLDITAERGLDVILEDMIFHPASATQPEKYGYATFATGNFLRLEAEYDGPEDVNPGDGSSDSFFYKSTGRVGNKVLDKDYSNNYYWVVSGVSGLAYNDITYRWAKDKYGPEFRFLKFDTYDTNCADLNELKIRFALTADLPAKSDNQTVIANITIKSHEGSKEIILLQKDLTVADLANLPIVNSKTGLRELVVSIPVSQLITKNVCKNSGWYWQLTNISPTLTWNGTGTLRLDYVDIYDTIYEQYTTNPAKRKFLRNFSSKPNLKYFLAVDEPKSPHFKTQGILEKHLGDSSRTMLAAVNYDKRGMLKTNGEQFSLTDNFIKETDPRNIMIDRYPFADWNVKWHNTNDKQFFVQYKIDEVLAEYNRYKMRYNKSDKVKLFYVTQTFGQYESKDKQWLYLLPPDKMAKCLQLLPLCYQADGVLAFLFDSVSSNQYAMVNHAYASLDTTITPQYYAVRDANLKLKAYGDILNDKSMDWIGAQTITEPTSFFANDSMINEAQVIAKDRTGLYKGYIQVGLYTDANDDPYFMAVNRRTTIVKHPLGSENDDSLDKVLPAEFDKHYVDAPPQYLRIVPSPDAGKHFGSGAVALYDPYDQKIFPQTGSFIEVEIGPGDGKLLKMCASLPKKMTSGQKISDQIVIAGDVTLDKGAKVDFEPGSTAIVGDNATITIKSGSSLSFNGVVKIGSNVQFNVEKGGSLIFKNTECTWKNGSGIKVTSGNLLVNGGLWMSAQSESDMVQVLSSKKSSLSFENMTIDNKLHLLVNDTRLILDNTRISPRDY